MSHNRGICPAFRRGAVYWCTNVCSDTLHERVEVIDNEGMSFGSSGALHFLAVATLVSIWTESPARACSVATRNFGTLIAPSDGTREVPPTAKIWIDGPLSYVASQPGAFSLRDDEGNVVPIRQTQIGRVSASSSVLLTVFSPENALRPGMTYWVQLNDAPETTFTVSKSDAVTDSTPEKPVAVLKRAFASGRYLVSSCGPANYGYYEVPLNRAVVTLLDIAGRAQISGISGVASTMNAGPMVYVTWDGAGPFSSTQVRFGQFDISGNFSGWSDFQTLTLPASPYGNGGCTGGSGMSVANAGLWFIPVFGLLRRRKKPYRKRRTISAGPKT